MGEMERNCGCDIVLGLEQYRAAVRCNGGAFFSERFSGEAAVGLPVRGRLGVARCSKLSTAAVPKAPRVGGDEANETPGGKGSLGHRGNWSEQRPLPRGPGLFVAFPSSGFSQLWHVSRSFITLHMGVIKE